MISARRGGENVLHGWRSQELEHPFAPPSPLLAVTQTFNLNSLKWRVETSPAGSCAEDQILENKISRIEF